LPAPSTVLWALVEESETSLRTRVHAPDATLYRMTFGGVTPQMSPSEKAGAAKPPRLPGDEGSVDQVRVAMEKRANVSPPDAYMNALPAGTHA
jgi:hypothetical protein